MWLVFSVQSRAMLTSSAWAVCAARRAAPSAGPAPRWAPSGWRSAAASGRAEASLRNAAGRTGQRQKGPTGRTRCRPPARSRGHGALGQRLTLGQGLVLRVLQNLATAGRVVRLSWAAARQGDMHGGVFGVAGRGGKEIGSAPNSRAGAPTIRVEMSFVWIRRSSV